MLESHYYSAGQCGYIYKFKFVDMHALHLDEYEKYQEW